MLHRSLEFSLGIPPKCPDFSEQLTSTTPYKSKPFYFYRMVYILYYGNFEIYDLSRFQFHSEYKNIRFYFFHQDTYVYLSVNTFLIYYND